MGFFAVLFIASDTTMAQTGVLTIEVDVFSGRPNPSVTITDPDALDYFNEGLSNSSAADMANINKIDFNRLGYRGIIITYSAPDGEIIKRIKVRNGKIKVSGAANTEANFLEDNAKLEKYFLALAKGNDTVSKLINEGYIPNPDSM
jgi:hypothetical protein